MKGLGPKRWNYFVPGPQKECKNGGVFLTAGLSLLFTPFLLSSRGAKQPFFIGFLSPPFLESSANIHQQQPQQKIEKGDGYHALFEKPVFDPKHQKATKTLNPPLKTWFTKSSESMIFLAISDVDHVLTLNVDFLLTLQTPKCGPLIVREVPG